MVYCENRSPEGHKTSHVLSNASWHVLRKKVVKVFFFPWLSLRFSLIFSNGHPVRPWLSRCILQCVRLLCTERSVTLWRTSSYVFSPRCPSWEVFPIFFSACLALTTTHIMPSLSFSQFSVSVLHLFLFPPSLILFNKICLHASYLFSPFDIQKKKGKKRLPCFSHVFVCVNQIRRGTSLSFIFLISQQHIWYIFIWISLQ